MTDLDSPAGRALPRDPPSNAPSPPAVQKWNRRIVGWGLAPLLLTGMMAGLIPGGGQTVSVVGAVLVLAVTIPVTATTVLLRRRNQSAYQQAVSEARERGMIVRVVDTRDGGYDYVLAAAPKVERIDWSTESTANVEPPRGSS